MPTHLVHVPSSGRARTLATTVETANTVLSRGLGLMFRRSIPDGYALAFRFDRTATRDVHMVFVPFPIDVVWMDRETVTRVERLRPWLGYARARADTVVELPAGAADGIAPGDVVRLDG